MAEEAKKEVTVVASYMVKHMSDGTVVTEAMKGDLTDDQILADIEALGKQVTERNEEMKTLRINQNAVISVVRSLIPEIADEVYKKINSDKVEKKPEVKKVGK